MFTRSLSWVSHVHLVSLQHNVQTSRLPQFRAGIPCCCVRWAHVRADPAGLSPGTPEECRQWLESAPPHLSQLDGIRHPCLCNASSTRHLPPLHPPCTRCCQIYLELCISWPPRYPGSHRYTHVYLHVYSTPA